MGKFDFATQIRRFGWYRFWHRITHPALTQLIALEPVDFVPPSADQIALIRKALPEISRSTVPAQTYPSQERDYATIGLFNFAVAHKDLPDDLVYKIVKTVFDNREELMKA